MLLLTLSLPAVTNTACCHCQGLLSLTLSLPGPAVHHRRDCQGAPRACAGVGSRDTARLRRSPSGGERLRHSQQAAHGRREEGVRGELGGV